MTRFLLAALACTLLCGTLKAEVMLKDFPSPDGKYEVRVHWMSEAPDFTVRFLRGKTTLGTFHPDPEDKSLRVFWNPGSSALLMEHVTRHGECRLYLIRIAGDHLATYTINVDPEIGLLSIVDGSVVWNRNGPISMTARTEGDQEKAMRIEHSQRLRPE